MKNEIFTDDFLSALGAWQKGWKENQDKREVLAKKLKITAQSLPKEFKVVKTPCYRKRFLHEGELIDIIMNDEKKEGMVSWTTIKEFAERFKGVYKNNAISGAIFKHLPTEEEVIVNVATLWKSKEFIECAEAFKKKGNINAEPLFNFKDSQGEVILESSLKGSEIIVLTGKSSPFDDLCDTANIPIEKRDDIFSKLVKDNIYPGEYSYCTEDGTKRIIASSIRRMNNRILELKNINT